MVSVRHYTSPSDLKGIKSDEAINHGRPAGMDANVGVHVEVNPVGPLRTASKKVGATSEDAYVDFQMPPFVSTLVNFSPEANFTICA